MHRINEDFYNLSPVKKSGHLILYNLEVREFQFKR